MRKIRQAAALKYESGQDDVPTVIASGRGSIAQHIIEIAVKNEIPIYKDQQTVDILCSLPIDSEIPEVLYQVVAEIYAYIIAAEKKK